MNPNGAKMATFLIQGGKMHQRGMVKHSINIQEVNKLLSFDFPMHFGELEVISLAVRKGIKKVLIDDAKARSVADLAGLQPVGTLWVILQAVKNRMLDFDEFLSTLRSIIHPGFYLKDEVNIKIIRQAQAAYEIAMPENLNGFFIGIFQNYKNLDLYLV
jgi:predicted nucleic acid-binding protein